MGKQNFIQGGFTGKVGQLIGARWKDMYIIKANTKPANPRTEKQQANRATFRDRVQSTKLAFQANYDTTLFNSTHATTWAIRMKAASQMYATDKNILEYCPLIPYGYVPDYPTSEDPEISGNQITLAWNTEDDIGGRVLSVLAWVTNTATQEYETLLLVATVGGTAGSWTATATLPNDYSFDDDTYIVAISRDSTDAENKVLYQAPVHTGSGIETVVFTLSNPVVEGFATGDESYLFTLTPSQVLPDCDYFELPAIARGVLQGDWSEATAVHYTGVINGTVMIGDFENLDSLGQRPMFVTGSTLVVPAFSYIADEKRWKFEGATFNLAETPTLQILIPESTTVHWTGSDYELALKSTGSWTVTTSADWVADTVLSDLTTGTITVVTGANTSATGLKPAINTNGNTIRWGANQTGTFSDVIGATSNGVTYETSNATVWTIEPQETEWIAQSTLSSSDSIMFIANTNSGGINIEQNPSSQPKFIGSYNGEWFDTFEMDWDSIVVTPSNPAVDWDYYQSDTYLVYSISLTYPNASSQNATVHIVNDTTKRAEYTVPNTDGFKYVQQILPFDVTFTNVVPS